MSRGSESRRQVIAFTTEFLERDGTSIAPNWHSVMTKMYTIVHMVGYAVHGIHVAASLPSTDFRFPMSIADADHRGLAADRNLNKMPNTCHLRGAQRCKIFLQCQSQTSARSFCFPLNKLCQPFISCIPGPCYPVTEVNKWQQQPKLQQRQQQRIPSNAG